MHKNGPTVYDVLQEKHPHLRVPDPDGREASIFEQSGAPPDALPLDITAETVESVAARLHGSAGPCGVHSTDLQAWLLRFGAESEMLREEMAAWCRWLANESPPWAAYRALMACRSVALDKQPGVRPLGVGEVFRRLLAKCVLHCCVDSATRSCGLENLCVGLKAGIEGAAHAMHRQSPFLGEQIQRTVESNNRTADVPGDKTVEEMGSRIEREIENEHNVG